MELAELFGAGALYAVALLTKLTEPIQSARDRLAD
jgi:hypothetical protein